MYKNILTNDLSDEVPWNIKKIYFVIKLLIKLYLTQSITIVDISRFELIFK